VDINTDQIRRDLREADERNRAAVPRFVEAIKRAFDPASRHDAATKAEVLGLPAPGRRTFLKMSGLTVLSGAVLAACGSDSQSVSRTGNTTGASTGASSTGSSAGGAQLDTTLAKTAASLEALAIATYDTAIGSGLVTTPAVGDAAKLFKDHHAQHLDAINKGTGVDYTTPNAAVQAALVDPAVAKAKTEADVLELAYMLEDAAAQTYVFAASALSTPALRSTIMTIGGTEAMHKAVLAGVLKKAPADIFGGASFYKKDNPLAGIDGAVIM
jgi:hypothetical protein